MENVSARPAAATMSGLDAAWVRQHLVARGLIEPGVLLAVTPLSGGVSSDIVAVSGPGVELVVKRPLGRLRVEQEWHADARRILTEGRALRVAERLLPGSVPPVLDLDEDTLTLVLQRAPSGWTDWRGELLGGNIDPRVGRRLGTALGVWHRKSPAGGSAVADFAAVDVFVQLRIDPFYRTVALRYPAVAPLIERTADALLATKSCLVHGDFSPKNVLAHGDSAWVLDWEVAHVGDPVFDIAFLLTHLLLKAVHRPAQADEYGLVARGFLEEYHATGPPALSVPGALHRNIGCLLLARVDGKSPTTYLTGREPETVRALGFELLQASEVDILGAWARL